MEKKVLVGTFIKKPHVSERILKSIIENFNTDKIFIFSVEDDNYKRLVTFNIDQNDLGDKFSHFKKANANTIRLHRRKESNTFYTINGLNKLVCSQNGSRDNSFGVSWDDYKNCCVLVDKEGQFNVLKTKLAKVIDWNKTI